ncbi:MAG TPA: hypothetical protein VJL57_00380 [Candidatus Paceibacterota bacterium]
MAFEMEKLEERYYGALRGITKSFDISETVAKDDLPTLLEEDTSGRLSHSNIWFLSGISGSGKSTIVKMLEHRGFGRLPNVVTRPRRPEESEQDNVFVDDNTFIQMEQRGELFHPHITNGARHAVLKKDIEHLVGGKHRLYMDKSVRSVARLLKEYPTLRHSTFIYVLPPSFSVLRQRIMERESEASRTHVLTEANIISRFDEEIQQIEETLAIPYVYVVNDSVNRVKKKLKPYT